MTIKFLKDHEVQAIPPETFRRGEEISDRSEASERHFVSRRVAAYLGKDGALTDIEGKPVDFVDEPADDAPASDDNDANADETAAKGKGRGAPANVQTTE